MTTASAIEAYPEELTLGQARGEWVLYIHTADVRGRIASSRRETLLPIAELYAQMRRDQEAGTSASEPKAVTWDD